MVSDHSKEVFFDNLGQSLPEEKARTGEASISGIFPDAAGHLLLRGQAAKLFRGIEQAVKNFATSIGAEEVVLPGTLSLGQLDQSGYLDHFPQMLTLLCPLSEKSKGQKKISLDSVALAPPQRACCSAVCLSCYPHFANQTFRPNERLVLTALGRAFRQERINSEEPERLNDFNMREIIFFGDQEFVQRELSKCLNWLKGLAQECQLRGVIQSAEDPFFGPDSERLREFQKATRSKFEFLMAKPKNSQLVAVASVNAHGAHFAKSFNLRFADQTYLHTGCFGVGLERFTLLLMAQYGSEIRLWPKALKARFDIETLNASS